MTFKTVTTWDYYQSDAELAPMKIKYNEMIARGITVDFVVVTSEDSSLPVIKERAFGTLEAAQEWKAFLESQPAPPVSCEIVEE